MSRVREGTRQTMAWLHGWSGLLLGHILYIIAFAGTLTVFKPEIGRWMRPESVARADPVNAATAAVAWLQQEAPDAAGWYLALPDDRMNTLDASFDKGADYIQRTLDAVSGLPVPRETLGGEFFYRLHFELQLPYPWGRLLASLVAAFMLVAIITGIIAHRRFFRDFFTLRTGKGQRSWLDGHNALGVLSLPFHIMITFTGILTLTALTFPWATQALYSSNTAAVYREQSPGAVERPASGRRATLAQVAPMLREAARRCGGPVARLSFINPSDAAAIVTAYCADTAQVAQAPGEISFDGDSGRVIGAWIERRPVILMYNTLYGLHMAHFATALLRWLYFLGGVMLTLAIATGLHLWTVKRRARVESLANRLLARFNAGMLLGVPIGAAAFLWANRLLPIGIEGRAGREVSISLGTWAVATVVGMLLPDRIRWPALFAVAAFASFAAPWLGGWWTTDAVLLGGNMLLIATGFGMAGAAAAGCNQG